VFFLTAHRHDPPGEIQVSASPAPSTTPVLCRIRRAAAQFVAFFISYQSSKEPFFKSCSPGPGFAPPSSAWRMKYRSASCLLVGAENGPGAVSDALSAHPGMHCPSRSPAWTPQPKLDARGAGAGVHPRRPLWQAEDEQAPSARRPRRSAWQGVPRWNRRAALVMRASCAGGCHGALALWHPAR
jgi:hypothetical protein